MKTPPGGIFLIRKASNYATGTTVSTQGATGTLLLDYIVPSGKELWVKATSINPNPNATTKGNFCYKGEAGDLGGTFTCATIESDDFNYGLVISQGSHFSIELWSQDGITAVGAEALLKGKLYPMGTYFKTWREL